MPKIGFVIDYSNINNLVIRKRQFIAEYTLEMVEAEKEIGRELVRELIKNSSYEIYKQRHKPPFPYSPKVNTPPLDANLANMQSGKMNKGWRSRTIGTVRGITTSVYNIMPYARFFDDNPTVKMIPRDLVGRVFTESIPLQREILHNAHVRKFRLLGEK